MESLAPENAGLDSELFSNRKSESALDVESAFLRESRLKDSESLRKFTESFDCGTESMTPARAVSETTETSAALPRFLFLLKSCPNIVNPVSTASPATRIILYVCFLNCNYFINLQKTNILHILDLHRNFLAVLAAFSISVAGFSASGQNPTSIIKLSTVVIDPGHGGKDAGCVSPSGKTMEKNLVLDISKRLAEKIKAEYPDVKVILTRSDDTFVTLQGRADIANSNNANLFISIHVNSVPGKRNGPNGYSVHILGQYNSKNKDMYAGNMDVVRRENSVIKLEDDYTTRYEGFDPNDPESYIFMNLMQNAYLEQSFKFASYVDKEMKGGAIIHSRGISQDPFYVLWRTAMPAVLIECGFMSNTSDREALITEKGRGRIASDIYDAFKKYKKEYDGTDAVNPSSKVTDSHEKKGTTATETQTKSEYDDIKPAENSGSNVTYGTQVLVSSRSMSGNDPFFKGYEVIKLKAGRLFKYIIGFSNDIGTAIETNLRIKQDFKDSFLVKVENGTTERIK